MSVVNRRFHDRAGNNLFQWAHAKAYALRIGAELRTDQWWGQEVFGLTEPPIMRELPQRADMDFEKWDGEGDIEITGWCLHQKCLIYTRQQAKEWLKFTSEITDLLAHIPSYEVAYHLRWGDFQTMADFIAISHQSYERAFQEFVPDFRNLPKMICAWESHRSAQLEKAGLGWLPDFAALMRAAHLFRANSTFSWWAATLGDNARVFSPKLNGIQPQAHVFQHVPFVDGNHSAISCFHPNCSDLYLPEMSNLSHLGGTALVGDPMTFCEDIWSKLIEKYQFKSMIDVGSGVGVNARWFLDHGIDAHAVEGFPDYLANAVIPKERMKAHDYTTGPYAPPRYFDLGWSSEFVEHVEERFIPNFMETFRWCKFVCMTHATPGQGGYHHVTERESIFWIEKMNEGGFDHLQKDTDWMRATGPNTHYGRRTLMLFKNRNLV